MRLYNGAPDSELKAKWDAQDDARKRLLEADPNARITWFPVEEGYVVWRWVTRPDGSRYIEDILPGFHRNDIVAINEAIRVLNGMTP